jgi:hypothetical protein
MDCEHQSGGVLRVVDGALSGHGSLKEQDNGRTGRTDEFMDDSAQTHRSSSAFAIGIQHPQQTAGSNDGLIIITAARS